MSPEQDAPPIARAGRQKVRVAAGWVITVVAFLLVWFALVAPTRLDQVSLGAFLRIPVEGLVVVAVGLVLPTRWRRVLAIAVGVLLGLLAIVKILDMGFYAEVDRPFDPVNDWSSFKPAIGVLRDTVGPDWSNAAVVGAVLLAITLLVLVPLSVLRLTRLTAQHRVASARTVTAVGVIWILCSALGVDIVAGTPVASTSATALAYHQVRAVRFALQDRQKFASGLAAKDPVSYTPANDLLTGLQGKDVVVAFVESYGRVAVQGTTYSPPVDAVLNDGTKTLQNAGFSSQSAFLDSPTYGGISWLAHSTLQSGLWINSQARYNQLVASNRFTLSDAFKNAGWRTVGDVPSNTGSWSQGTSFYHYDQLYNGANVGYAGPKFSYAAMPDQYILSAFQRMELAKQNRAPVMAEIDLVSSHTPWAPLPHMVPWNKVGNGSVFDDQPDQGQQPDQVWEHSSQVQAAYGQSVQYSLHALFSWVQQVHDNNLVLIVLGDHQPAHIVSGYGAGHDVPISIIAHDPAVLDRISGWHWQDGMLPNPQAPVWFMSSFRNRFLKAYGPHGRPAHPQPALCSHTPLSNSLRASPTAQIRPPRGPATRSCDLEPSQVTQPQQWLNEPR
jgi:hypothetical protein